MIKLTTNSNIEEKETIIKLLQPYEKDRYL
jgi:hypothetical protein